MLAEVVAFEQSEICSRKDKFLGVAFSGIETADLVERDFFDDGLGFDRLDGAARGGTGASGGVRAGCGLGFLGVGSGRNDAAHGQRLPVDAAVDGFVQAAVGSSEQDIALRGEAGDEAQVNAAQAAAGSKLSPGFAAIGADK